MTANDDNEAVLTVEERERWRRMFDAASIAPWATESLDTVIVVQYRRTITEAPFRNLDDAVFVAASRSGWPRTLDALELAEKERDDARNELEPKDAKLRTLSALNARFQSDLNEARDLLMSAGDKRTELYHENQCLTDERNALNARVAELERMLDAWRKHRNSPLLIADHDNYRKRNP